MARSHHRKKHKEHLRQFKHHQDGNAPSAAKGKVTTIFTFIGATVGLAVSYFAAGASVLWLLIGLLIGGGTGYFIGRKIDNE